MKQTMNIRILAAPVVALLAAASGLAGPGVAFANEPGHSPWVEGFNNRVRLIAGTVEADKSATFAGIELQMPQDWKTYWRNPGEAGGIPPEFDFAGSDNLESAIVLYPAPLRLVDPKAGTNIGYKDRVTFPVRVTAKDMAKPILLKLKATYGVCKDICVPAEAALEFGITTGLAASPEISTALEKVPASVPNSAKDPSLKGWRIDDAGGKPKLVLEVKDPGGDGADAFLFSPDGHYLPMSTKISDANGNAVFEVDLTDGVELKDLKGKAIAVTLAGGKGQSETMIQLP